MKAANVDDRQKRLLQEMLKFSKNGDKIITSPVAHSGMMSPIAKASSSSAKEKSVSLINQTPKKVQSSSDVHFSGSAFLSSPDPSALPIPDFEEDYLSPNLAAPIASNTIPSKLSATELSKSTKVPPTSYSQIVKKSEEVPIVEDKTETLKRFLKVRRT